MTASSHHITIEASKEKVFQALTTVGGLKGWYAPEIKGDGKEGGHLVMEFAKYEGPFEWKVTKAGADSIRWECTKGPRDSKGTSVTFTVTERKPNHTVVDFDHDGFKNDDEKLRVCNTLWGALAHHLKKYVESEKPEPALA